MKKRKKLLITGFGGFLIGALAFAIFFWASFRTVEVRGNSMEPTFREGARLLVSHAYWLVGPIKKGDIVVIKRKAAGDVLIKRVYAVAGDEVDYLNVPNSFRLEQGRFVVPPGCIYVLGDNRAVSLDSRTYGPFRLKDVIGKVVIARFGQ